MGKSREKKKYTTSKRQKITYLPGYTQSTAAKISVSAVQVRCNYKVIDRCSCMQAKLIVKSESEVKGPCASVLAMTTKKRNPKASYYRVFLPSGGVFFSFS